MKLYPTLSLIVILLGLVFKLQAQEMLRIDAQAERVNDLSLYDGFSGGELVKITQLDAARLQQLNPSSMNLSIDVPSLGRVDLDLVQSNILAPDAKTFALDANGQRTEVKIMDAVFMKGETSEGLDVRVNIINGLTTIMFDRADGRYFIESMQTMLPLARGDHYAVYRADQVELDKPYKCGADNLKDGHQHVEHLQEARLATSTGTFDCRKLEFALAADNSMFASFGTVAATSSYMTGILNLVEADYQNPLAFVYNIDIDITETVVITAGTNPWPTANGGGASICASDLLSEFCTWANGGGFTASYDLAEIWTEQDIDNCSGGTGVVGLAYLNAICSPNIRCSLIERFSGNSNTMRETTTHELGHNFGCSHTNPAGDNIMEPFVNPAAVDFSTTSTLYGNGILSTVNCLSVCDCAEIIQAVPTNCSPTGTYDLTITIEHQSQTGSFTLSAGSASSSFTYGSSPQTVTLTGVAAGTTTINLAAGACTDTRDVVLPAQSFTTLATTEYCVTDATAYPLAATPLETFGRLEIQMNSDCCADSEQVAAIYDKDGSLTYIYPRFTFLGGNQTSTVTTDQMNLDYAPFTIVVGDSYGDGLLELDCFGGAAINGSYIVRDGSGTVVFNGTLNNPDCNGNDALSNVHTSTPLVEQTFGGNFSGTGVANGTMNDNAATFTPATAGVGRHEIDYTFESFRIRSAEPIGCVAERQIVDVYAVPTITLGSTDCGGPGSTVYSATVNVNLGAWNPILAGNAASVPASSTAGTAPATTTGGTYTVTDIPSGTDITITVGPTGCQQTFAVVSPPANCFLPVELTTFTGVHQDSKNILSWTTETELNNDFFVLERRSEFASDFVEVATLDGAGTTSEPQQYRYADAAFNSSDRITYYRLKQVDFDGTTTYSEVVSITYPRTSGAVSVFPSPAQDVMTIVPTGIEGSKTLSVYDVTGRLVLQQAIDASLDQIDLGVATWTAGVYLIEIRNESGDVIRTKASKQ